MEKYCEMVLDKILEIVNKKNDDCVMVVGGREGSGKTDFSVQCCSYMDDNYGEENMVIRPEDFIPKVKDPKLKIVHVVEGGNVFFGLDVITKMGKKNVKMLQMCRFYNKIIWIDTPSLFTLTWYIRQHRMRALTYIKKRGWFWFYNRNKIKKFDYDNTNRKIILHKPCFKDGWQPIKDPRLKELYNYAEKMKAEEGEHMTEEKEERLTKTKQLYEYFLINPKADAPETANQFNASESIAYRQRQRAREYIEKNRKEG